jgi:acyl-CoA reductase-like NAD-dependent aldehyde dehydrogenase
LNSQLAVYEETADEQIDAILDRAVLAVASWQGVRVAERAKAARSFVQAMRERGDELARAGHR